MKRSQQNLDAWERWTTWPLIVAAILFSLTYAVPIIWPNVSHQVLMADSVVFVSTWVIFAFDYLLRFFIAPDRQRFFHHNLVDLASVALPALRPLRLLRIVQMFEAARRIGAHTIRGRLLTYVLGGTALLVFVGALAVADAERGAPGANITSFGISLWWSFVTVATVGFGDYSPVTVVGRTVAVAIMVGGVILLGTVSGTLASWLVQRMAAAEGESTDDDPIPATYHQMLALTKEVAELKQMVSNNARPAENSTGDSDQVPIASNQVSIPWLDDPEPK